VTLSFPELELGQQSIISKLRYSEPFRGLGCLQHNGLPPGTRFRRALYALLFSHEHPSRFHLSTRPSTCRRKISSLCRSNHPGPALSTQRAYKKIKWAEYTPETRSVASENPLDKLKISVEQRAALKQLKCTVRVALPCIGSRSRSIIYSKSTLWISSMLQQLWLSIV
jgi:hypothetical protein